MFSCFHVSGFKVKSVLKVFSNGVTFAHFANDLGWH